VATRTFLEAYLGSIFPGLVNLPNSGRDVAWTWRHYSYAPDPHGKYENMQEVIVHKFWVRDF
jgi:hypothetical protein